MKWHMPTRPDKKLIVFAATIRNRAEDGLRHWAGPVAVPCHAIRPLQCTSMVMGRLLADVPKSQCVVYLDADADAEANL